MHKSFKPENQIVQVNFKYINEPLNLHQTNTLLTLCFKSVFEKKLFMYFYFKINLFGVFRLFSCINIKNNFLK